MTDTLEVPAATGPGFFRRIMYRGQVRGHLHEELTKAGYTDADAKRMIERRVDDTQIDAASEEVGIKMGALGDGSFLQWIKDHREQILAVVKNILELLAVFAAPAALMMAGMHVGVQLRQVLSTTLDAVVAASGLPVLVRAVAVSLRALAGSVPGLDIGFDLSGPVESSVHRAFAALTDAVGSYSIVRRFITVVEALVVDTLLPVVWQALVEAGLATQSETPMMTAAGAVPVAVGGRFASAEVELAAAMAA